MCSNPDHPFRNFQGRGDNCFHPCHLQKDRPWGVWCYNGIINKTFRFYFSKDVNAKLLRVVGLCRNRSALLSPQLIIRQINIASIAQNICMSVSVPFPCCHHIYVPTSVILAHQNKYLYKLGQVLLLLLEHAMLYQDPLWLPLILPAH